MNTILDELERRAEIREGDDKRGFSGEDGERREERRGWREES